MISRRHFLGTGQPGLVAAAAWLLEQWPTGEMDGVTICLPGRRAGRRLRELLVDAGPAGRLLWPPRLITPGDLPERLLAPGTLRVAGELLSQLVWQSALRVGEDAARVVFPHAPPEDDFRGRRAQALLVARLHRELAAADLTFARVADHCRSRDGYRDHRRWDALTQIHAAFREQLLRLGFVDRYDHRLTAVSADPAGTLVLMGCLDLSPLDARVIAAHGGPVEILVLAPPEDAEGFDELGVVQPEYWERRVPLVPITACRVVDRAADAIDLLLEEIGAISPPPSADEVVVGLGQPELGPMLERTFGLAGVPARVAEPRTFGESRPGLFLQALEEYLQNPRVATLGALVRHPDFLPAAPSVEGGDPVPDPVAALDWLQSEYLPPAFGEEGVERWQALRSSALEAANSETQEESEPRPRGRRKQQAVLAAWHAMDSVETRARELTDLMAGRRPLREWPALVESCVRRVHGEEAFSLQDPSQRRQFEALSLLAAALATVEELPEPDPGQPPWMPVLSAWDALSLVRELCEEGGLPEPVREAAIDVVGWLELYLDDAPYCLVMGFNDGLVPQAVVGDAFLPDSLRRELGLLDNRRRYARDAAILVSRAATCRQLRLVALRRGLDESPLPPSRLFLASPQEEVCARVRLHTADNDPVPARPAFLPYGDRQRIVVPRPVPQPQPLASLSVTDFSAYRADPYRFYLRRVLQLEEVEDAPIELDYGRFGSILHAVLEEFAATGPTRSGNATVVRDFLRVELDRQISAAFGQPSMVIGGQVIQLFRRLDRFAAWQADSVRDGWEILRETTERQLRARLDLEDGVRIEVKGRIDRIDVHRPTGRLRVMDYKSGSSSADPKKTHRTRSGEWIDFQLPLYDYLLRAEGIVAAATPAVDLGYLVIGPDLEGVTDRPADWSQSELQEAVDAARRIARQILAQRFWPPTAVDRPERSGYLSLCLDRCLGETGVPRSG